MPISLDKHLIRRSIADFLTACSSLRVHAVCWLIFIGYEISLVSTLNGYFGHFLDYVLHYVVNICLFYWHALWILPTSFRNLTAAFWKLPLLLLLEAVVYISAMVLVILVLTKGMGVDLRRASELDAQYFLRAMWRFLYFVGLGTGYFMFRRFKAKQLETAELKKQELCYQLENQQLKTEVILARTAFLKSQINPHLLFNTLNFIYNSVRKSSRDGAEAVVLLSEIMRFALQEETEQVEVALQEELEQVRHLIRLNQLRFNNALTVSLKTTGDLRHVRIIPLVLLTLAENMFKHGELQDPQYPVLLAVQWSGNVLDLSVSNKVKTCLSASPSGIGLKNLSERLQARYSENVTVTEKAGGEFYAICIRIFYAPSEPVKHAVEE